MRERVKRIDERFVVYRWNRVKQMTDVSVSERLVNQLVHVCHRWTAGPFKSQLLCRLQLGRFCPNQKPNATPRIFDEAAHRYDEMKVIFALELFQPFEKFIARIQVTNSDKKTVFIMRATELLHCDSTSGLGTSARIVSRSRIIDSGATAA